MNKKIIHGIFKIIGKPLDIICYFLIIPSSFLFLAYRTIGSARLPRCTYLLKKIGVFPIRDHYFEPLFDDRHLHKSLHDNRSLPSINLNTDYQLLFLNSFVYSRELIDLQLERSPGKNSDFYMNNGSFGYGDADYLYQFIRTIKPSKVIEIGSGHSTKIAQLALQRNYLELPSKNQTHVCIEPYEHPWLDSAQSVELIRKRVEELEFDWSKELVGGDLLFIDSSHIIRPQGDVLTEYLDILPKLASGVFIHIHDIFTPKDYPRRWIVDNVFFWNEQYLLEALLSNTNRYEIVGALNYLKHSHFNEISSKCPYLRKDDEPGSFYLRVL